MTSINSSSVKNKDKKYKHSHINVEIQGGTAQAIVATDIHVHPIRDPIDLDVRFIIGTLDFYTCRDIVETQLLQKLHETLSERNTMIKIDKSTIRLSYFQKQVVVGTSFSLLSIGSDKTGKNIDIEFTSGDNSSRNQFDDASFVLPLNTDILTGKSTDIIVKCLSGPFNDAISLLRNKELKVKDAGLVINGLALYAHAISEKGMTPLTVETEMDYGRVFANTFIEQSREMRIQGGDPLRFLKSFLKSHQPNRPLSRLGMTVQQAAILFAYGKLKQSDLDLLVPGIAEIIGDAMILALQDEAGRALTGLETIIEIARFCTHSATALDDAQERSLKLESKDGNEIRLLRPPLANPHSMLFSFRLSFSISQYRYKMKSNIQMILNCGIPAIINALEMKDTDYDGKFNNIPCNYVTSN